MGRRNAQRAQVAAFLNLIDWTNFGGDAEGLRGWRASSDGRDRGCARELWIPNGKRPNHLSTKAVASTITRMAGQKGARASCRERDPGWRSARLSIRRKVLDCIRRRSAGRK